MKRIIRIFRKLDKTDKDLRAMIKAQKEYNNIMSKVIEKRT